MPNSVPYEVIAAPFTLYVATVGTAFPDVDEAPSASWTKVGTSGPLNYDADEGVIVEPSQSLNFWRSLGDAGSRKVFRSEEDLKIRLTLMDLTLEQFAHAVNNNAVTDVNPASGTPGYKKLGLSRGFPVSTKALLVRANITPYSEDPAFNMQFQVWRAAQTGNPSIVFKKDVPAGLALEWTALVDPAQPVDQAFGILIAQDGAAL